MDDAKIIKFNLDVLRREISLRMSTNVNALQCLTQITQILAKNKKKNTIVLRES